jgi:hypothetical protein
MQVNNSALSSHSLLLEPSNNHALAQKKQNQRDNISQQQGSNSSEQGYLQFDLQALSTLTKQAEQRASSANAYPDQTSSTRQQLTAVSSYQQVDALAKRDSLQQLFGVDLFA